MSGDDSNDLTTNQEDTSNAQPTQHASNFLNRLGGVAFNNQPIDLTGFNRSNMTSGLQFQQAPYSGILQPGQSISFQQSTSPGTFQCDDYYLPQTTHLYTQSLFCPQPTTAPLNLNNNPKSSHKPKKRTMVGGAKGRLAWNIEQDIELCVAWLKISEDPIVATNQPKGAFWTRVTNKFNKQMSDKHADHVERSLDGCNSRWRIIHPTVTKWAGILAEASRNPPSGWNETQIESLARNTYQQTYSEPFAFEECWKVLKDSYKWKTWSVKKGELFSSGWSASSKITYVPDSPVHNVSDTEEPLASFQTDTPQSVATRADAPHLVSVDIPEVATQKATIPVGVDIPEAVTPKATISGPILYGPSQIKRPMCVKKAKNERQCAKQRFVEAQSEAAQQITGAILSVDKDVEERGRRAEEAIHKRDENIHLHLEAENNRAEEGSNRAKEEHLMKKEQHVWEAISKRTTYVKDLEYMNMKLKEAYKELELTGHSSIRTPREQFDHNVSKELVELLQSQRTELKK